MTRRARLALLAAGCWACASGGDPAAERPVRLSGGAYAMGTALELTFFGRDSDSLDRARLAAIAEVERVEARLSSWRPESEISRLNAAAGGAGLVLSGETRLLLERCLAATRLTSGAFDVTVGPLLQLWKRAEQRGSLPTRQEREAALARVGPRRLVFESGGRVRLAAGSSVDLGAVAKGYALDRAREQLPGGVEAALLNFGRSSTWALGRPPGSEGWRLLVQSPGGDYAGTITLRDQALAVSGSFGQVREIRDRRYSHVIDPRDGEPVRGERLVLVVGSDAARAEMLATALVVLGPEAGLALAESEHEIEALLLDVAGRGWRTRGWKRRTRFQRLESSADSPGPARRRRDSR